MRRPAILLALVLSASGCMTTRAHTPVERPTLDVPPVPPRIIEPAPPPEVATPEPVPDLPPEPAVSPTPRPRPATSIARETQKPEVKPEAAPPTEPEDAQGPPPSVPVLRTPATANAAAAERQIIDTLRRAQTSLNSVDYQRLSLSRQRAYNEAKDFINEAETHLKVSNLEAAKELAEKAEKYAVLLLQGR